MKTSPSPPESGGQRNRRPRDVPQITGRLILQPRDEEMLVDLESYGCMRRDQIQCLYFGSLQAANLRLRKLFDWKYVARTSLPVASDMAQPAGSQAIYALGPSGIPVVAARTGMDPGLIRSRMRNSTTGYLLHTLEIVSFRLAMEAAVRSSPGIRLERFLPERLCLHAYEYQERGAGGDKKGGWKREIYKPDSVVILACDRERRGYAVEIDCGNSSSDAMLLKAKIHDRYAQSGLFAKRYGVDVSGTLCVTTSERRRDNLRKLMEKAGFAHFRFTTFADIQKAGALGYIWHEPGGQVTRLLPE